MCIRDSNTGDNVISRITRGKNTTESPNTVGTDQKKNSPPPFMAFTKNKISSRAPTPHKIHFISRFWEEISGTTVSAATSIMEAVTTENKMCIRDSLYIVGDLPFGIIYN